MLIVKTGFTRGVHEAERVVDAVISTPAQDRDGDIVEVSGWEMENFLKNPVVLWMHRYDAPVGRCLEIRREGDAIVAKTRFARTPLADEIWQLYREGVLSAWSVSFIALDWEPLPSGGRRYRRQELLEYSAVSVPANPEALNTLYRDGMGRVEKEIERINLLFGTDDSEENISIREE
ncbi:MAG: HK97 family phage prohead protease [candidate division WOR-3 bacterium]